MRSLLINISVAFFLVSCNSVENSQNNGQTSNDNISVCDSIIDCTQNNNFDSINNSLPIISNDLTAIQQKFFDDTIVKFFTPQEIEQLYIAMDFRTQIASIEDVYKYYTEILPELGSIVDHAMQVSFPEVIYSGDDEPARGWRSIGKFIPELYTDCPCSECTSMAYIEIGAMQKLAKKTASNEDDNFFKLEREVYEGNFLGDNNTEDFEIVLDKFNSGFYITDHCDICSYQSFGNDFHYRLFDFILKHKWEVFKNEVDDMFTKDYLMGESLSFYYEKDEVITEMHDIQTLSLPKSYKTMINNAVARVEKGDHVYFGCQNWENNCPTP